MESLNNHALCWHSDLRIFFMIYIFAFHIYIYIHIVTERMRSWTEVVESASLIE